MNKIGLPSINLFFYKKGYHELFLRVFRQRTSMEKFASKTIAARAFINGILVHSFSSTFYNPSIHTFNEKAYKVAR